MTPRWTTAVLDTNLSGGRAVARSPEGFWLTMMGRCFRVSGWLHSRYR
jgi:NAD+ diphosphatase